MKKKATAKATKQKSVIRKTKPREIYAVIANGSYGLYVGIVEHHDRETRTVIVRECRHVAQWYGRTGGITSLAAHGLCGPRMSESLIGDACLRAELSDVVNVFECSPEARITFEASARS